MALPDAARRDSSLDVARRFLQMPPIVELLLLYGLTLREKNEYAQCSSYRLLIACNEAIPPIYFSSKLIER